MQYNYISQHVIISSRRNYEEKFKEKRTSKEEAGSKEVQG